MESEEYSDAAVEDTDNELEDNVSSVMNELIDEVTLGMAFEVHRACRLGKFFLDDTDQEAEKKYEIVDERGVDIFGQVPMKKQYECVCPSCSRTLAASRFAPHLEKCMGMGRNSSRIASRRIANTGKKDSDIESDNNDNDNDNDWSYVADRRVKKLKKDKSSGSPRRSKSAKNRNGGGDIPSVGSNASEGSNSQALTYELTSLEERKSMLHHMCGVVSEHTKRMCTRSVRCPQHTDEQRRAVRQFLLGQSGSLDNPDDDHVDIDTYVDGDSQALRDTLQWEAISNPSPADSTSTTNSTSSRKRKRNKHSSSSKNKKGSSKHTGSSGARSNTATPTNLYDFM